MTPSAQRFADLLTQAVHQVKSIERKSIAAIQDDLGYLVGRKGGATIEHWRKGHLPPSLEETVTVARALVKRGRLPQTWLHELLTSAGHPAPEVVSAELFPLTTAPERKAAPSTSRPPAPEEGVADATEDESTADESTGAKAFDAILYTQPGKLKRPAVLFGRDAILAHLYTQLEAHRHLLLTGFGGTGKSALAATVAEAWLVRTGRAVLWLMADTAELDTLLEAMVAPFDCQTPLAQKRGDAKLNFVQQILQGEGVGLVVLDNVEHLTILAQIHRAIPPNTALLVTSRYDAAHMDESIKVPELEADAAVALLAHHAQNEQIALAVYARAAATPLLCARLSYHALGLVIAGGWLKQSRRPAADLLRRLDAASVTPLTIEMPPAARQPGQASVELVLAQTLRSFGAAARKLFGVWGALHHAQATAELLALYVGMNTLEVEDALDELVAWNFAERVGSNLYSMHAMIHHYARHRRQQGQTARLPRDEEVMMRYVTTYAHDFANVTHNLSNLLATAERAEEAKTVAILAPLTLAGFFDAYGYRRAVLPLLDRAVEHLRRVVNEGEARGSKSATASRQPRPKQRRGQPTREEQARLLHFFLSKQGNGAFERGDYAEAAATYGAALAVAPNAGRTVRLTALVGKALAFGGDVAAAEDRFAEAHESIVDDDMLRSFVLEQEAHAAGQNHDHHTALRVATEQVTINRRLLASVGDPASDPENYTENLHALFHSLNILGTAMLRSGVGRGEAALAILQEAMALAQKHNYGDWMAHASSALAESYHTLGDRTQAAYHLRAALRLYQEQEKQRDYQEVLAFVRKHGYTEVTMKEK
jgi:tetratricopeptide (TPR) repeat protein